MSKAGSTVTANLLTGLGLDEFFTRTDGTGTRALLPDALGFTTALSDNAGNLQTQYTYEPFGYVSQTGQANGNSYKFTGREDDGTGLSYYRARYYQPRLQRFVSEDPIEFNAGDLNLYAYVFNSPSNYTDPTGEFVPQLIGCSVGAGISAGADLLSGRKIDLTDAAIGCGLGAVGGFGYGKTVKVGIHSHYHEFPRLGGSYQHVQVNWWTPGVKGSQNSIHVPLPRGWTPEKDINWIINLWFRGWR